MGPFVIPSYFTPLPSNLRHYPQSAQTVSRPGQPSLPLSPLPSLAPNTPSLKQPRFTAKKYSAMLGSTTQIARLTPSRVSLAQVSRSSFPSPIPPQLHGENKFTVFIGNARFASQRDDPFLPSHLTTFEKHKSTLGRSATFVSITSSPTATLSLVLAISLWDNPKPSSIQAIRALESMGVEVSMMTGDNKPTALTITKQVEIDIGNGWANMSSKGKASVTTEMIEQEDGAAMVCFTLSTCYVSGLTIFYPRLEMVLTTLWHLWPPPSALCSHPERPSQLKLLILS
jgi:hypothetical protein